MENREISDWPEFHAKYASNPVEFLKNDGMFSRSRVGRILTMQKRTEGNNLYKTKLTFSFLYIYLSTSSIELFSGHTRSV